MTLIENFVLCLCSEVLHGINQFRQLKLACPAFTCFGCLGPEVLFNLLCWCALP
jgi:hypothetical protein